MDGKPKRRWLRFRLRTVLLGLTLTAIWFGYYANWRRARVEALDRFEGTNNFYGSKGQRPLPLGLRLLGESPHRSIWFQRDCSASEFDELIDLFPEAEISGTVNGSTKGHGYLD